jgi:hypothetical protein
LTVRCCAKRICSVSSSWSSRRESSMTRPQVALALPFPCMLERTSSPDVLPPACHGRDSMIPL